MPTPPYDSVIVAINAANTRLNGRVETLQPIGGQVVGNTQAFSQQVVNDAWRKMQGRLADLRYSGLQTEIVYTAVPATATTDPAAQSRIDFTGFWNGAGSVSDPVLPQSFIRPYALSERQNGTANLFTEMDPLLYQIPRVTKANWNRQWLWRHNAIYLPGALVATDIAMVYAELLADFDDDADPWFTQPIPILNCIDALADYICREIYVARGDLAKAAAMQLTAQDSADLIMNQDSVGAKSIAKASEHGKMRDQYTPGAPPPTV